jgi:hypothetical protein
MMLASAAEDRTIRLYHVGHITGAKATAGANYARPEWLPELPGSGVVLQVNRYRPLIPLIR